MQPNHNPITNPCRNSWQRKWLELDVTCPAVQAAADAAERFCGRFFRNIREAAVIVLYGTAGTGKTHLAEAIGRFADASASAAWNHGNWGHLPTRMFVHWPCAADGFKAGHFGIVEDAMESDLLILDDVGSEHDPSGLARDKLCQILSRRENRFTVITTNIEPSNWGERFDIRISDRFLRNSELVDLTGVSSYQLTKPSVS